MELKATFDVFHVLPGAIRRENGHNRCDKRYKSRLGRVLRLVLVYRIPLLYFITVFTEPIDSHATFTFAKIDMVPCMAPQQV